jgi:hypothetical protein
MMAVSSRRTPRLVLPALIAIFSLLASASGFGQTNAHPQSPTDVFHPGEIWNDNSGTPINAHGGGFLYRGGTYYWFGEFKTAGRGGNAANVGISCYSSKDLYHWKNEGIALKVSQDPNSEIIAGSVLERPKVLYNERTKTYVMWFHLELKGQGYSAARAGVAISKSPTGPYTFLRSFRPDGEMSRDMTLYADDDGKAYLITTSENNQTQHLSQLTDDYLDTKGHFTRIFAHKALEGSAIFKVNGHYFYIGSHTTGWNPNPAYAAVAESLSGPWTELGNPCRGQNAGLTFGAQSTYVLPVVGKPGAFIFISDRWRPDNAIDGRYVWLPIDVEGNSFTITWRPEWDLNQFRSTTRSVGADNNGRRVPSTTSRTKP